MKPASIQFLYSHGTGAVERLGTYFGKKNLFVWGRVANSLLSQELKLCFSDTKFTKAPYTKKDTSFFLDTK